jgi:sugar lactone lactonase YvrE
VGTPSPSPEGPVGRLAIVLRVDRASRGVEHDRVPVGVEIEPVSELRADIGEGPVWSPAERRLYLVDCGSGQAVHRYDPATAAVDGTWPLPEPVGSMALRRDGGAVVALASGFATLDLVSGRVVPVVAVEEGLPTRLNDGKASPGGSFFCGSFDEAVTEPLGALYRLDPDFGVHQVDRGVVLSNGLAFSPDGRTLYFADTIRDVVWSYDHDPDTGELSRRRVFVQGGQPGGPDGATVDADGCLWSVRWGGGRVVRYTPDGAVDRIVELPVAHPTCPAFGGPDLDVLYVTTGRHWVEPGRPAGLAGALFQLTGLGVRGCDTATFAG